MQTKATVVRVHTLSGVWETLGVDTARGIWPEDVQLSSDHYGPSKATFTLHRDPGMMWPDLGAFTPIEVEIGGILRWSGFLEQTPTNQAGRVINAQCKGWQYHLDDDVYQRVYVHAKLADYKDIRGVPSAVLGGAALNAAGQVTADGGQIYLGWPNGTPLVPGATVGAVLDLGSGSTGKCVVVTWEGSNNASDFLCIARGADVPTNLDVAGNYNDAFSFALNTAASGTTAGTLATARRYIKFYLYNSTFTGTLGADYFWKVNAASVFADTAYQSADVSILKATQIIPDALDRGTLLLSDDRSQIDPGATVTFAFPEFALDGQKSTREVLNAANAVHDYVLKIDARRRPIFKPKPSAPSVESGGWHGSNHDDGTANSGEDIYNRVKVQGTTASGENLTIERSASQADGVVLVPVTSPAPDNPSFATNTTSWTASTGTAITRDTATFNTTPASGRWDRGGGNLSPGDTLTETLTGTFRAGVTYTLDVAVRSSTSNRIRLTLGVTGDIGIEYILAGTTFTTAQVSWTPTADATTVTLGLLPLSGGFNGFPGIVHIDSLALATAQPTLVDRRGFRRTHVLPVKCSLTVELATQIADVWLAAHKTTPFKGTVRLEGDGGCREILTGANVPPEALLDMTGELLRLNDRIDPDTGGQGRDGRIASVDYDCATDTAVVSLDSRRTSHEALLERLAVVIGTG